MKLARKSESQLMCALGCVLGAKFMARMWTTLGQIVYVPTIYDEDPDWGAPVWKRRHLIVLAHERTHIRQFTRYGWALMALLYLGPSPFLALLALAWTPLAVVLGGWAWWVLASLGVLVGVLLPLTFGLAWGRWFLEREAFQTTIRLSVVRVSLSRRAEAARTLVAHVADSLWRHYAWCWPRRWARAWFTINAVENNRP